MVLTKAYLRYASVGCFGIVCSARGNGVFVKRIKSGSAALPFVAVPALEDVIVWDIRTGDQVVVLKGGKYEVTALAISPDENTLAVGYFDGTVKLWGIKTGDCQVTFSGHKSAVTVLKYDSEGSSLVSGARDTDVIIWDVVGEAGKYRLRGHKGMITQCLFLKNRNVLITSSKDTFVKFWDLDTQHCFLTLVGHRSEVWDFTVVQDGTRLVTGCADSELRVWEITYQDDNDAEQGAEAVKTPAKRKQEDDDDNEQSEEKSFQPLSCELIGSVMRQHRERVMTLKADASGRIMGCQGNSVFLELFTISTEEELEKKMKKKLKKRRKALKEGEQLQEEEVPKRTVSDEVIKLHTIKGTSKIKSFDITYNSDSNLAKILLLLDNNSVEVHTVNITSPNKAISKCLTSFTQPGHRTDIRTLCFNSDSSCILSGSHESIKVWNRSSQKCIRTIETEYALCSFFVPGDRHAIVGTKVGSLEIYDIASGMLLETVDAHTGPVWSISLAKDKKGFVSGSGDCDVKFWEFELVTDANSQTSKRLSVAHVQTLKMSEEVLCVKYSPDQRFLAVCLLDCTVKVFFADTLKFFLSLYGHKLPVMAMDISSDGTLIVTGSADKNIKLWGLDFGDCHKSIFAHDDSIMNIQFVPKTHYFFSVSKDKSLKYWDGDKFEHIMTLEGHHAEIWSVAVSNDGDFVVTGSHDKSIRLWERTEEPLFVQEEREQQREAEYEEALVKGQETVIPGERDTEAVKAGKRTVETIKATERLMEALELYKEETAKINEHKRACIESGKKIAPPPTHPVLLAFGNISPLRYVLQTLQKIRSSEIEEALVVLPFSYVVEFLQILNKWIEEGWEIELSCRCLFFLLRIHNNQIVSNRMLLPVVDRLRQQTAKCVQEMRDTVGFNLAGLQFIQRQMEDKDVGFFTDATEKLKHVRKKRKTATVLALK